MKACQRQVDDRFLHCPAPETTYRLGRGFQERGTKPTCYLPGSGSGDRPFRLALAPPFSGRRSKDAIFQAAACASMAAGLLDRRACVTCTDNTLRWQVDGGWFNRASGPVTLVIGCESSRLEIPRSSPSRLRLVHCMRERAIAAAESLDVRLQFMVTGSLNTSRGQVFRLASSRSSQRSARFFSSRHKRFSFNLSVACQAQWF